MGPVPVTLSSMMMKDESAAKPAHCTPIASCRITSISSTAKAAKKSTNP